MSDLKTTIEKIKEIRRVIALQTTMIDKGEKHTDRSLEFINKAISYLDELKKANDANKQQQQCSLDDVSNRRELLIRFLTNIDYHELDKCNYLPNIPDVVDRYLKSN